MVRCKYCPKKFRAKGALERHVEKKHKDMKIRRRIELEENKCPLCGKTLKNVHGVLTHIRRSKDKKHQVNYEVIKRQYKEYADEKEKEIKKTAEPKVHKKKQKKTSFWSRIFGFK